MNKGRFYKLWVIFFSTATVPEQQFSATPPRWAPRQFNGVTSFDEPSPVRSVNQPRWTQNITIPKLEIPADFQFQSTDDTKILEKNSVPSALEKTSGPTDLGNISDGDSQKNKQDKTDMNSQKNKQDDTEMADMFVKGVPSLTGPSKISSETNLPSIASLFRPELFRIPESADKNGGQNLENLFSIGEEDTLDLPPPPPRRNMIQNTTTPIDNIVSLKSANDSPPALKMLKKTEMESNMQQDKSGCLDQHDPRVKPYLQYVQAPMAEAPPEIRRPASFENEANQDENIETTDPMFEPLAKQLFKEINQGGETTEKTSAEKSDDDDDFEHITFGAGCSLLMKFFKALSSWRRPVTPTWYVADATCFSPNFLIPGQAYAHIQSSYMRN